MAYVSKSALEKVRKSVYKVAHATKLRAAKYRCPAEDTLELITTSKARTTAFASFDDAELRTLASYLKAYKVVKGQQYVRKGERASFAAVLLHGSATAATDADGEPSLATTLESGEMLSEIALFDDSIRPASVTCTNDCQVVEASYDDVGELSKEHPGIAVKVMQVMLVESSRRLALETRGLEVIDSERSSNLQVLVSQMSNKGIIEDLKPKEVEAICGHLELASFSKGEQVVEAGVVARHMLVLLRGQVELVGLSGKNKFNVTVSGRVLGEGFLTSAPHEYSIQTIQDCTFAVLNKETLERMVGQSPGVAVKFLRNLGRVTLSHSRKVAAAQKQGAGRGGGFDPATSDRLHQMYEAAGAAKKAPKKNNVPDDLEALKAEVAKLKHRLQSEKVLKAGLEQKVAELSAQLGEGSGGNSGPGKGKKKGKPGLAAVASAGAAADKKRRNKNNNNDDENNNTDKQKRKQNGNDADNDNDHDNANADDGSGGAGTSGRRNVHSAVVLEKVHAVHALISEITGVPSASPTRHTSMLDINNMVDPVENALKKVRDKVKKQQRDLLNMQRVVEAMKMAQKGAGDKDSRIAELERLLAQKESAAAAAINKLKEVEERFRDIEATLETYQNQEQEELAQGQEDLEAALARIRELEAQLGLSEDDRDLLRKKLNARQEALAILGKQQTQAERENQKQQRVSTLVTQFSSKAKNRIFVKRDARIVFLEGEVKELRSKALEWAWRYLAAMLRAEERTRGVQADLLQLYHGEKARSAELQLLLDQKQEELQDCRVELGILERELQGEIRDLETELLKSQSEVAALGQELEDTQERLGEVEERCRQVERSVRQRDVLIQEKDQVLEKLKAQLPELRQRARESEERMHHSQAQAHNMLQLANWLAVRVVDMEHNFGTLLSPWTLPERDLLRRFYSAARHILPRQDITMPRPTTNQAVWVDLDALEHLIRSHDAEWARQIGLFKQGPTTLDVAENSWTQSPPSAGKAKEHSNARDTSPRNRTVGFMYRNNKATPNTFHSQQIGQPGLPSAGNTASRPSTTPANGVGYSLHGPRAASTPGSSTSPRSRLPLLKTSG